ncbi:hypothetical protein D5301_10820 [Stenotrophomonas sp. MH181796]|nr:hypothetical protein [Stenotrophomonas sp. MH181796]
MALNPSTLRRYTQWLPILVWVVIGVAWWSPLGVIAGLAACLALGGVLQRFDLIGDAVGGERLRSRTPGRFANRPPAHDVQLEWGELGMGGPVYSTQMLRDGAIVEDIAIAGGRDASCGWKDVPGSALRWASCYVDRCEAVIVYDERHKVVYVLAMPGWQFWQQLNAQRQSEGDAGAVSWLRSLPSSTRQLYPCRGLWLHQAHPALSAGVPKALRHVLPDARVLQAIPLLPDDLRLTAHPTLFARICPYALCLDGEPSDRHACDLETVIASPSGRCVVVAGSVLDGELRPIEGVWLVHWQGRWQAIGRRAMGGSGKARSGAWIDVIEAGDDGMLRCEAYQERWEFDDITRCPTVHTSLALPVEWRDTPLALRARNGRFNLRIPSP